VRLILSFRIAHLLLMAVKFRITISIISERKVERQKIIMHPREYNTTRISTYPIWHITRLLIILSVMTLLLCCLLRKMWTNHHHRKLSADDVLPSADTDSTQRQSSRAVNPTVDRATETHTADSRQQREQHDLI